MAKKQRLDKAISMQGNLSRSEVKTLIRKGAVTVNGQVVKAADFGVDFDSDTVQVQGKPLCLRMHLYLMLNKPKGVVSASEDKNQPTVVDLVPQNLWRKGLFPAGRLDKDTTGFVLITDDGEFAHDILSPKKHIPKTYHALVDGAITEPDGGGFCQGSPHRRGLHPAGVAEKTLLHPTGGLGRGHPQRRAVPSNQADVWSVRLKSFGIKAGTDGKTAAGPAAAGRRMSGIE